MGGAAGGTHGQGGKASSGGRGGGGLLSDGEDFYLPKVSNGKAFVNGGAGGGNRGLWRGADGDSQR